MNIEKKKERAVSEFIERGIVDRQKTLAKEEQQKKCQQEEVNICEMILN